jgi:hypothetical protein
MLTCIEALEKISSLSGLDLDESIDISIESGNQYSSINYISGYIKGLDNGTSFSNYESGVYEKECSISTGMWVYKDKVVTDNSWCLKDCYEPYTPICKTKEPIYIDYIYEPDVFESNTYEQRLIYKESFKPCGWVDTPEPYIPTYEIYNSIYEQGNSILNQYSISKGLIPIEIYDNCYETCYQTETIELDREYSFVINKSTCYEEGVYENCYTEGYFVYWQTSFIYEESCYDSCTVNSLFPLFFFTRRQDTWLLEDVFCKDINTPTRYIDNDGHLINIEVSSCIDKEPLLWNDDLLIDQDWLESDGSSCFDNCYEKRYYYYDEDRYVYQEGVYESGVYTKRALLMSLPFMDVQCPTCNISSNCLVSFLGNIILEHHYNLEVRGMTRVQDYLYSKSRPLEILDSCCTRPYVVNDQLVRINGDVIEIFQEGLLKDDYLYSLDIGYTIESTNEFIPIQSNVPISLNGFYSLSSYIPEGIKTLILYKSNYYFKKEVVRFYGASSSNQFLIQDSLSLFNSVTNTTTIEDISISLILLLLSSYKESKPCSTVISFKSLHPYIKSVIDNNLDILSTLIDNSNDKRRGSIPKQVRSNTKPEHIYDDSYYLEKRVITCYEEGVYSNKCDFLWDESLIIGDEMYCLSSCFKESILDFSINREVDNRSIAWLLLAYLTYTEVINTNKYQSSIDLLYEYLISEIDYTNKFIYKGYSHSDIYSNSTRLELIDTSTNIAVCIALLKHYSVTSNSISLLYASKLKRYIYQYLYSRDDNLFMDEGYFTLDSNLYGLWLSLEVNEAPAVETILDFFTTSLNEVSTNVSIKIDTIDNEDILLLDNSYIYTNIESISLRNNIKVNNLLYYLFNYSLQQGYTHSFFIFKDTSLDSNIGIASCLSDSLFEHELFRTYGYEDIEVLETSEALIENRLRDMMPIGFDWFSRESLTRQGNIGNLLGSVSGSLALNNVSIKRIKDSISLTNSRTYSIKRWEQDLKMVRWESETYTEYKDRVRKFINKPYIINQAIPYLLSLYKIDVKKQWDWSSNITNKYNSLFFSTSNAYIQETDTVINTHILVVNFPITPSLYRSIEEVKPIGTKVIFDWQLDIETCLIEQELEPSIVDLSTVQRIPSYFINEVCCSSNSCRVLMKIELEFAVPYPLYLNKDSILGLEQESDNLTIIRANNLYSYFYK